MVGGDGIHAVGPPGFWKEIRDAIAADFRRRRLGEGLRHGIAGIGQHLEASFPWTPDSRGELPDPISTGEEGAAGRRDG